jgi:hypothetical protein
MKRSITEIDGARMAQIEPSHIFRKEKVACMTDQSAQYRDLTIIDPSRLQ